MFPFSVAIYIEIHDRPAAERISRICTGDADTAFHTVGNDGFKFSGREYVVLISDRIETVKDLDTDSEFLSVIYLGHEEEMIGVADRIDTFIPAGADSEMTDKLIKRQISDMRTMYERNTFRSAITALTDSVPDLIWFKDQNGCHYNVNKAFANVAGKTKEECQGQTHGYIWNIDDEKVLKEVRCVTSEDEVKDVGHTIIIDEPLMTPNGTKQLTTYKSPFYDDFGNMIGTTGLGHDVTDFTNIGLQLSMLLENMPAPLLICDKEFRIIQMNRLFRDMTHLELAQLAALDYNEWKKRSLTLINGFSYDKEKHSKSAECSMRIGHDERFFSVIEQEIRDHFDSLVGYYCIFYETTMRHKYEKSILKEANTDALTGLYNSRYFYEYAGKLKNGRVTLLYMDIDHFKQVNDRFGHARGDDVLKKTAAYISEIFSDAVSARLGGDEFAVLITGDADVKDIEDRCAHLERCICSMFREGSRDHLSISIGMSSSNADDINIDELIHRGDSDMYDVKRIHHRDSET